MREFATDHVSAESLNQAYELGYTDGLGYIKYSNPYSIDDEEFYHYSAGHKDGCE